MSDNFERKKFLLFRFFLGLYAAGIFALLIPYSQHLFSLSGMFAQDVHPIAFFSFFSWVHYVPAVQVLLGMFCIIACLFALGFYPRIFSLILWYGWASVSQKIPYLAIPSDPFIGWLFLACALIEWKPQKWTSPTGVLLGAWVVFSLTYSFSGWQKLGSPSWIDGSILFKVLHGPIVRDTALVSLLRTSLSEDFLRILSYLALGFELLFAPLALWKFTRILAWAALTLMHVVLLVCCNLTHVSFAMLLVHLFIFNVHWLPKKKAGFTGLFKYGS